MSENVPRERPEARAVDWWKKICAPEGGDAAARAKLRRCHSANEVVAIPQGVLLARMLGDLPAREDLSGRRFTRALNLARVLSHIRENDSAHPMRTVGWPKFPNSGGDAENSPRLSEPRFRRLLQSETDDEMVSQFTRLLALMDGKANVREIAYAFRIWDHADGKVKERWAVEYLNARPTTAQNNSQEGKSA